MINFPSNPSLNQFYTSGGKTWKWVGNRWVIANANTTIDFNLTTANVAENGNLYFTNARARSAFTSGSGITIAGNGLITANTSGGSFIGSTDAPANLLTSVANVALTGNYTDLNNVPVMPSYTSNLINNSGYLTNSYINVSLIDSSNTISNIVSNVSTLRFDSDSGFDITNLGQGAVKVGMNSTFKTWKVNGSNDLVAIGLDTIEFVAGNNISITTNTNASPKTIIFDSTIANTDNLLEGANLYFTNARVYANVIGLINAKANITDLTTSKVTEGDNLYFTNARARSAFTSGSGITLAANGLITASPVIEANAGVVIAYTQTLISTNSNSYALTTGVGDPKDLFVSVNGLIQIPTTDYLVSGTTITFTATSLPQNSYIEIRYFGTSGVIKNSNVITDSLVEGNINLFFTNARTRSAFIAGNNISIDANGLITAVGGVSGNTNSLVEGSENLYFTNARVYANVIGLINTKANVTDLTTSNITEGANLYFTNQRVISAFTAGENINIASNGLITANIFDGNYNNLTNKINFESFSGNIIPESNNLQNLGNATNRWHSLYVGPGSIDIAGETISLQNGEIVISAPVNLNSSNIYWANIVGKPSNLSSFTNDRNYANVSYVDQKVAAIVDSAPASLDTLNELANALNDDSNFASNIITLMGEKSGNLFVQSALLLKANITDLTTSNVTEGTNLYFTNARSRSAFVAGTGITIEANGMLVSAAGFTGNTSVVPEGSNLYFTNARVYANVIGLVSTKANSVIISNSAPNVGYSGDLWFDNDTADLGIYFNNTWIAVGSGGGGGGSSIASTSELAEGSNLYYTNARVYANVIELINGKANVTDLTTSNVTEGSNLYFTNARVASYINQFVYSSNIRENGDTTSGNVYFSNSRARAAFTAGNGITIAANGMIVAAVSSTAVTPANISDQVNISTGYLAVPSGNTAQRPVSPANGFMRYNTSTGYGEIYNAIVAQWLQFGAAPTLNVEYLVVAGGGAGGGGWQGGGGGAGGYQTGTLTSLALNSLYNVTVGAGGSGGSGAGPGGNGSNSVFNNITSIGGGRGAGEPMGSAYAATVGGSGGGGSHGGGTTGASGTSGQGNSGGNGISASGYYLGGGGGGAGGAGVSATTSAAGAGGPGAVSAITGISVTYAGGGGGTFRGSAPNGAGGAGGGGAGGSSGTAGTTNTGGGGGAGTGGSGSGVTGAGGSGVVIIKYLSVYNATFSAGLTTTTATSGGYKITTITAGTGTVTFTVA